jgi:hypothetical protein
VAQATEDEATTVRKIVIFATMSAALALAAAAAASAPPLGELWLQTSVSKGSSPRVRAAAKHELPMLNMHLRLSKVAR